MKIKIIDILNKIANNEEPPKKIMYEDKVFIYHKENTDYLDEDVSWLFDDYNIMENLNDEVERLETTINNKKDNFTGFKLYADGKEICSTDYSIEENIKLKEENLDTTIFNDALHFQDKIEKIEKLNYSIGDSSIIIKIKDKINEIIDHIQE